VKALNKWLRLSVFFYLIEGISYAGCPSATFNLTPKQVTPISFENFGDLISGITKTGFQVDVIAPDNNCPWDLYIENGVTITQISQYSTQGAVLPFSSINIRADNPCTTADQEYPFGTGIRPIPAISDVFAAPFTMAGPYYVIGPSPAHTVLMSNHSPCAAVEINDDGDASSAPTTHRFNFDFQIIPGVASIVQPGLYRIDMSIAIADDASGLILMRAPYSIEVEIQSFVQLQMTSSSEIAFDFTEIKNYTNGITKYGATKLNASSNVNWDLMAIGTSTKNENSLGTNPYWDNSATFSTAGSLNIPLDALELFQTPNNPAAGQTGAGLDYSPAFVNPPSGNNNIEVAYGSGVILTAVAPYTLGKTIAGNWGALGAGNMVAPGSFNVINAAWNRANFSYTITYRLVPGLPVFFSHSKFAAMPSFAKPGSYTMEVKYILTEDQ